LYQSLKSVAQYKEVRPGEIAKKAFKRTAEKIRLITVKSLLSKARFAGGNDSLITIYEET
jgi:hypothetical protein